MNYQIIYNKIISKAQTLGRNKSDGIYYERHHIIPKCMGGSNESQNLILLTAREHFICHHLLCRIYPNNRRLIHAFWLMCNTKNQYQSLRYTPSSSVYKEARELNAKLGASILTRQKMSKSHSGKIKSDKTKLQISISNSKPKERTICPHCNKNISVGTNSSRWHFDRCKHKIGNELLDRKSGNPKQIQCMYCFKIGGINVMHRWHFNKCKNKQISNLELST